MPLSQLDPIAALIVIDLQKGIVGIPMAHPATEIVANAAALARAFRERMQPVILVNVTGMAPGRCDVRFNFTPPPDWAELIPELDQQPDDYTVTKKNIGAFYGTALEQILRRRNVTQIFLAGISTGSGVEATARQAYDQGYNVVTVSDAMTDRELETHAYAVEKVFPRISETATTAEVLAKLKTS